MPDPVLAGVDRAAFVAALAGRLRAVGVPVTLTGMTAFANALEASSPDRVQALYWLARLTLVNQHHDLDAFDRIFDVVFGQAQLVADPHSRRSPDPVDSPDDELVAWSGRGNDRDAEGGLPWHTLPSVSAASEESPDGTPLPELLPSAIAPIADTPFDELDEAELALLGRWLDASAPSWPTRRSRRMRVSSSGHRIALRETIAASRRTGWEPMRLQRQRPVLRPLPITMLCDVSQSMQSYAAAYLHLMRAFVGTRRAEAFVFSTSLTRVTPALAHRSARAAIEQATAQVDDRYGGTRLATALHELLASRHGHAVRGGILVIASDGWDSDDPDRLAAVMAKAARRARRVVWLNPRAAAPAFEPRVASMAAALPFCDVFLPAHTLRALPDVFAAISSTVSATVSSTVSSTR
jgi:uncharacterized protein with von Willebrand factor type A (vWA) domain